MKFKENKENPANQRSGAHWKGWRVGSLCEEIITKGKKKNWKSSWDNENVTC